MKKILTIIYIFTVILILSSCDDKIDNTCTKLSKDNYLCQKTYTNYFDTIITINLYTKDPTNINSIYIDSKDIISMYNNISDKYNEYSNLVNINTLNNSKEESLTVDDNLIDILKTSKEYHTITNGYFNILLEPVIDIWDTHRELCNTNNDCSVPDFETSKTDLNEMIKIDNLVIENNTITLNNNAKINLGGIAKGYMVNKLAIKLDKYITSKDIEGYIINSGTSSIKTSGINLNRDSGSFKIGITDPDNELSYIEILEILDNVSISTSGTYQRFYEVNGVIYHHIINPFTLSPSGETKSVTVIAKNSIIADIYSTYLLLIPIEDGINIVNSTDDLEAFWYSNTNETYYSIDFDNYISK